MSLDKQAIKLHKKLRGKIEIQSKIAVNQKNLSLLYTPGVAAVSRLIFKNKKLAFDYTSKWNSVAIVTDGSRVLGLGNIGPEASLPVMEGKSLLFKVFGGVNAYPLPVATQRVNEIVSLVKWIEPNFGGVNLEDIEAPRCFEVEERLEKELNIPVFHDDQHGTAIVTLAALINALKLVKKDFVDIKIVIAGAGAAGLGIVRLLRYYNLKDIIVVDSYGAIYKGRKSNMNRYKEEIAKYTNKEDVEGDLQSALINADVFIGVSGVAGLLKPKDIRLMNKKPIVFPLTNPNPEIMPADAKKGGAYVIGTGRSDFPNQINNSLVFPGIFRGALDVRAKKINDKMKLAAAYAIAKMVKKPTTKNILPHTIDKRVVKVVASAVKNAA